MHFQIDKSSNLELIFSNINNFIKKSSTNKELISEITIISSEIIYNIVKFSPKGEFEISLEKDTFIISAKDEGSGFIEVSNDAFKEGFSTAGSLGLGLPSLVRMCDDIEITTSKNGTFILCKKSIKC